ncbi:hypothetical protein D3C85_553110 [compost metagenome]
MHNYEHSPSRAGEVLLAQAVAARKQLNKINREAIKATGLRGDALIEALVAETARIRSLDHKEVSVELALK